MAVSLLIATGTALRAQEPEVERPAPPALEDFEKDANKDGIPDGWYNLRDAKLVAEGGVVGPHCLRFDADKPGRPARLSRAFGIDGRKTEALVIGLWVRSNKIQQGERLGEDPSLIIDFLGEGLRSVSRGMLGPWSRSTGARWERVAKRIAVPPGTRDAILSLGLLGATGTLEVDGLTIDLVPVEGTETTNLVRNGDFELGNPEPGGWVVDGGAFRSHPGYRSATALELSKSGARAMTGVARSVELFTELELRCMVRAQGLRGGGGAEASVFFLDDDGRTVPGLDAGINVFRWAGSTDWRPDRAVVAIPRGASRAVIQFDKTDPAGSFRLDNLQVTTLPDPAAGAWTPYHVEDDTTGWLPVQPSSTIAAQSALDASFLLDAPAGKHGFVTVREGRLGFTKGGRARFFGVVLLAPTAFLEPDRADALADRLARSGVNLVRLSDLDTPLGPDRSLFDDSRDDTRTFDALALAKLDHLIAAFKARGIYVALELQSVRKFRVQDGVADVAQLPIGGGPAAIFDPVLTRRAHETAQALLGHVNPETGLSLSDDPVLAWVTLAGEVSLFDMIDNPAALPPTYTTALKALAAQSTSGTGRRFWEGLESAHWKALADDLRRDKLRVPVASVSHWRREPEFAAALAAPGLDLIDDRLYWNPLPWSSPERRSLLWSLDGGLAGGAARKRKTDRPYVVGQWCHQTEGAWAFPHEGADELLAAQIAATEDWDALVRRGVFVHPQLWGSAAVGTAGGEDLYPVPEVVNGIPQVFGLWPHVASLMLHGHAAEPDSNPRHPPRTRRRNPIGGWDPERGRLVIDTPYTRGLAGWPGGEPVNFEDLAIETDATYAVIVASSVGSEPIAASKRLLVTAVARIEPTGYRWADSWKHEVADRGRPPLLAEPLRAKLLWRHKGPVQAFALDNTGARLDPVTLRQVADGVELDIEGSARGMHWELVAE